MKQKKVVGQLSKENLKKMLVEYNVFFTASEWVQMYTNHHQNNKKKLTEMHSTICDLLENEVLPYDEAGFANAVKEFFDTLKFYTEQATEPILSGIITDLIIENLKKTGTVTVSNINRFAKESFLQVCDSFETWWTLEGQVPYLTERCRFFDDAKNNTKLEEIHLSALKKLRNDEMMFCQDILNSTFLLLKEFNEFEIRGKKMH
uniref:(northern house mosquito) hypothetical protein n=1 Tax=Culex pipiens TaxID=7175 RepID=A0A8D8C268_CULPI